MRSNTIDDIAADTPLPGEAANGAASSSEDQLVDRLMARLAQRGLTLQPQQPQEPEQQDQQDQQDHGSTWDQSWDDWNGQAWSWTNWRSSSWNKDEKYDRPYISHLDFPKFNGKKEEFHNYQYAVLNLKSQCAPKDYKFLAPKLIANFTGSLEEDARAMELLGSDFQDDEGVEKLLDFLRKRLHITDLSLETEAFDKYFTHLARKKGETLMKYINAEETAYRKLQRVLKTATQEGEDEYSDDDGSGVRRFQLPKRLRGWHFLGRAAIPLKEHSGILNQTGGMNVDKLKKVMAESLPDKNSQRH